MSDDNSRFPLWLVIAAIALFILLLWFGVRLWRGQSEAASEGDRAEVSLVAGPPALATLR